MSDEQEEKICKTCGVDLTGEDDHSHEDEE